MLASASIIAFLFVFSCFLHLLFALFCVFRGGNLLFFVSVPLRLCVTLLLDVDAVHLVKWWVEVGRA